MSRGLRRGLRVLAALALLGTLVGADGNCAPPQPVTTLESLEAQVNELRDELCAVYALQGETPDLVTYDPDCPEFEP